MNTKRVIIFDFDGVMVDSIEIMSKLNKETFPDIDFQGIKDLHKENIFKALEKVTLKKKVETPEEFKERFDKYSKKKLKVALFDGIKELISRLSEDNVLVVNTSATTANSVPILERNGIKRYFDLIADKEFHKSKVEKFKLIAERYNKQVSELIFITDTIGDVREAVEAGVTTIVVTWGIHKKEDFKDEDTSNVIGFVDTPEELLALLESR